MKLKTWIKYYSPYLPPRCRKYRYEQKEEYVDIELRVADASNLIPAFQVEDKTIYLYGEELYQRTSIREVWGGNPNRFPNALEALKYDCQHCSTYFGSLPSRDTRERMIEAASKDIGKYLLVGPHLYTRTTEPRYVVMTFGLGNNHGATALMVDWSENPNLDPKSYFCALDAELAIQYANEVARERGDTDFNGTFHADIEVLAPNAVSLPRREVSSRPEPLWTIIWKSDRGRNWERLPKSKARELVENLTAYGIEELHIFRPDSGVEDTALEEE